MFEGSEHPFSSYFGYSVNRAPGFWYVLTHHHFAIASIASIFALPMPEEPPERIGPWSFVASLVCLKTGYPKSWWSWSIHDFPCKYCFILLFISIYFLFPSPSDQVRLSLSVFMYLSWLIPLKLSAWWCFEGMPHFHTHPKSAGRCHSRSVSAKTPVTRAQVAPYRNFRSCEPNSLRGHGPMDQAWETAKNGLGTREFSTKYLGGGWPIQIHKPCNHKAWDCIPCKFSSILMNKNVWKLHRNQRSDVSVDQNMEGHFTLSYIGYWETTPRIN